MMTFLTAVQNGKKGYKNSELDNKKEDANG